MHVHSRPAPCTTAFELHSKTTTLIKIKVIIEQKMHSESLYKTKHLMYGIKQNLFAISLTAGIRNFKTAMTFFFKATHLYLKRIRINLPTLKKQC